MGIEIIGKQIASLRKERGIKQEELANYVGVSTQAVSKWEHGGVPDTELLPVIADFFSISLDELFGRSVMEYSDFKSVLSKSIFNTPYNERLKLVFDYCWDMERALFGDFSDDGNIEAYEKSIGEDKQNYSSIMQDEGFTRMGIANRSQYFLIVPNPKSTDNAYFNGIDYPAFFKDISDRDVWSACVFLNKRNHKKAFTPMLLVNNLDMDFEKAKQVLSVLQKYRLIHTTQIEMDDEIQTVYHFWPTPSFIALMIFAREIIDRPEVFAYYSDGRTEPYLK